MENEGLKAKNRETERRMSATPLAIMGPSEDKRRGYLDGHALKVLKNDLDEVMREVNALDNSPGGD